MKPERPKSDRLIEGGASVWIVAMAFDAAGPGWNPNQIVDYLLIGLILILFGIYCDAVTPRRPRGKK